MDIQVADEYTEYRTNDYTPTRIKHLEHPQASSYKPYPPRALDNQADPLSLPHSLSRRSKTSPRLRWPREYHHHRRSLRSNTGYGTRGQEVSCLGLVLIALMDFLPLGVSTPRLHDEWARYSSQDIPLIFRTTMSFPATQLLISNTSRSVLSLFSSYLDSYPK